MPSLPVTITETKKDVKSEKNILDCRIIDTKKLTHVNNCCFCRPPLPPINRRVLVMQSWRTQIVALGAAVLATALAEPARSGDMPPALVRRAPSLEGRVEGSVQMMTGEDFTLECSAAVIGDLLVPGRPTVRVNGGSDYRGTLDGTGATSPNRYTITLNRGSTLWHVIRRTDPAALPAVGAPPQPSGRRSVTISRAGQSAGDFSTLKSLTLARNAGLYAIPAGTYGGFTANNGSGFILGVAGAVRPASPQFPESRVRMRLADGGCRTGCRDRCPRFRCRRCDRVAAHPAWLALNLCTTDVALENGAVFYGHICAPRSAVTVSHNAMLVGGVVCDRLTVNRGGLLRLIASNQPPTVALTAPVNGASLVAFKALTLVATAADADGSIAKVEFFDGATKLGAGAPAASQPAAFSMTLAGGLPPGVHTLTAVATDSSGAAAVSPQVSVSVTLAPNLPPQVTLTEPASTDALASNVSVILSATATDADGTIAKVEFFDGATKLGEVAGPVTPPSTYTLTLASGLTPGSHSLFARATDSAGASTDSIPVSVTVPASLPYLADFEAAEGFAQGSLAGQLGWRVSQGAANVTSEASYSGARSVVLPPGAPPADVAQTFAPLAGHDIIYVDFFAHPVADADLGAATTFDAEGSRFALVRRGAKGELHAFDGDGAKGGQWRPAAFSAPLSSDGQTLDWIRLTARLDFGSHAWDLYANGQMVAADLGFHDSGSTALTAFGVQGNAAAATRFDYFLVGPQNPLFADVNENGIDDAWETAHGLSLASNNRKLSPGGNGVTVIQAYLAGLDPQDYYCGVAPALRWEGQPPDSPAGWTCACSRSRSRSSMQRREPRSQTRRSRSVSTQQKQRCWRAATTRSGWGS